jgi:hypothetical protein
MIEKLSPWLPDTEYIMNNEYNKLSYRNNAVKGVINRLRQPGDQAQWNKAKNIIKSYDTIRPNLLQDLIPGITPYL